MPTKYLDEAGLTYFWSKIKQYIDQHSGGGGGVGFVGGDMSTVVLDSNDSGTSVSDIIVASSGVNISFAGLSKFGNVVQLDVNFSFNSDISVPASGNFTDITVGTINQNYRPPMPTAWITYGNNAGFASGIINSSSADGSLILSACEGTGAARTIAAGSVFQARATYVIAGTYTIDSSGGLIMSTTTASLGTTGWSNNAKTVNVTGVTSSNTVIISPAPADADVWAAAGIICTAQGSGTLTFECDTVPSSSLTANILILEEDS